MNFSKKQKVLMWAIAALALLIITNPSAQAFKEHQGKSSYNGLVRKYNFFICSVYHDNSRYGDYIGLIGNFVQEGEHKVAAVYTVPVRDSNTGVDTIKSIRKYDYSSFDKAVASSSK